VLEEGRQVFRDHELGLRSLVVEGDEVLVFLWAGDRALSIVLLHLRSAGIAASNDGLAIAAKSTDPASVRAALGEFLAAPPDPDALARLAEGKNREKHHRFLTPELLDRDYASAVLDADGAVRAVAAALHRDRI
jgi:hypothetical protein